MFVEAGIIVNSKTALAIPIEALITENDKNFVLLLDTSNKEYAFKKVKVTIGEKSDKFVELISTDEINTSSKILTKGVFDVIN